MIRIHPSNQLQHGDVRDFCQAMDLYRAQLEFEKEVSARQPVNEFDRKLMHDFTVAGNKAMTAKGIYERHVSTVKDAVIAELRGMNDPEFTSFADALESGDYSILAI